MRVGVGGRRDAIVRQRGERRQLKTRKEMNLIGREVSGGGGGKDVLGEKLAGGRIKTGR